jgi:hypothetical protein
LAHRELGNEVADRPLVHAKQVEDAAAIRLGEHLERGRGHVPDDHPPVICLSSNLR